MMTSLLYLYGSSPANFQFFLFFLLLLLSKLLSSTMPKCWMSCTALALPLAANHICPQCKRLIRAICVGKHLEDALLGRDIICFVCAEASSESDELEEELHRENEVTPATI
jgi:hypothetical protein